MGSFRSQPELNKTSTTGSFQNINFAVTHMCGWRMYMEDADISVAPFSDKKFALFGIFDGHGGAEVAIFVERYFAKQLKENSNFKKQKYELALKETFLKMDELLLEDQGKKQIAKIQKQMRQKGNAPNYDQPSHAGCTANVVLITPEHIYCANSGDSRAVASVEKAVTPLSEDHKPQNKKQIDRITKAGGTVQYGRVNGNLNLSRALGDLQYKRNKALSPEEQIITADPDIKKIKNQKIDFIIMGCDGIWQVKSNEDMVKWVSKKLGEKRTLLETIEDLLSQLVAKDASSEYGMDNMSAILIHFGSKPK